MADKTGIEWTNRTWNPTTGCDEVSPGCKHCYARPLAMRLQAMGNPRYVNGFAVTLHRDKLREPLGWTAKGELVFVNSMSDLLHEAVPDDFILDAFEVMAAADWHTFQVLTKRGERWGDLSAKVIARLGRWPRNVLPGVSVENRHMLRRLEQLAAAGDKDTVRMVSVEPLLGSLVDPVGGVGELARRLSSAGIGWVITGGEAGFQARAAALDWFREVRDACVVAAVPFFHKQHGGVGLTKEVKRGGTLAVLDGVLHHAMPVVPLGKPRRVKLAGGRQASLPVLS